MTAITKIQALCLQGVNACLNEFDGHFPYHLDGRLQNYVEDLNAMAALEKKYLINHPLQEAYLQALSMFTDPVGQFNLVTATPVIRAKAFLLVAMQYLGYGT